MSKLAPGISHSVIPTSDVWNVKGLNRNELRIKALQWIEDFKNEDKIPKHRMPHRFHENKLKSA